MSLCFYRIEWEEAAGRRAAARCPALSTHGPPDPTLDCRGHDYRLRKLEGCGGSYINAEMVKALIDPAEHKARFGP